MTRKQPRKIDLQHQQVMARYALLGSILPTLFRCLTVVFFAWMIYKCCDALAGRTTFSEIIFGIFADRNISKMIRDIFVVLFGVSGLGYGVSQRNLRRKDIKQRSGYIERLEARHDPKRSSSHIGKDGTK